VTLERRASTAIFRETVESGLRWNFWLAIFATPFSYGTTLLLARIDPQVLGAYGVLGVYTSIVSTFLFLGGNAVVVRFVAAAPPQERWSFLVSYAYLVAGAVSVWLLILSIWPQTLGAVFSAAGGRTFQLVLAWLAPAYVAFCVVQSTLRAVLEMAWAQALGRVVSVGLFLICGSIVVVSPATLATHYIAILWGGFVSLTAAATAFGTWRLVAKSVPPRRRDLLRFRMPQGFWVYCIGVQSSSTLGFFTRNLDAIFLLNAGGMAGLGEYVAIMTIVLAVPQVNGFFLESMVPALMNSAGRHADLSQEIVAFYVRLTTPVVLGMAMLALSGGPLFVWVLGTRYRALATALEIAAPFGAIQALSGLSSTLLIAAGLPYWESSAKILRVLTYVVVFLPLWSRYQLIGAIVAWGVAEAVYHVLTMYVAVRRAGYSLLLNRAYFAIVGTLAVASAVVLVYGGSFVERAGLWLGAMGVFAAIGGYTIAEVKRLCHVVMPTLRRV
jgi:O-antigen/teichoic acid export membrane protein